MRLLLMLVTLCLAQSIDAFINPAVTNKLYDFLFRRPESASLSSFPYCYEETDDSVHRLFEGKCGGSGSNASNDTELDGHGEGQVNKTKSQGNRTCANATERHSALDVYFDVSINQVLEVNERQRSMRLKMTYFLMWTDCRLSWSISHFPLHELHISIEQFRTLGVYVPILMLNEEITPEASKSTEKWILIMNSGTIYLERMYTTEISCAFDISMYPFDTQACNLTFESVLEKPLVSLVNVEEATEAGIIDAERVPSYLSLYHLGMGRFIPSDTWEVVVLDGHYHPRNICAILDLVVVPDKCLYDLVAHQIVMRRHPSYQLLNLLLPAFLIVTISSCVFLLPPGTGDKTNLSITILLSLFIFMQIMYYKMPETGETLPLLTQYYLCCVGLIVFSCIAGTFSVALDSTSLPIPRRVRNFMRRYGSRLVPDRLFTVDHCPISQRRRSQCTAPDCTEAECCKSLCNGSAAPRRKSADCPYEWRHVATIFDRSVFIIHIVCSAGVLTAYLVWGYVSYTNYGFLLTDAGWKYRDIQMRMVGDSDVR